MTMTGGMIGSRKFRDIHPGRLGGGKEYLVSLVSGHVLGIGLGIPNTSRIHMFEMHGVLV